MFPNKEIGREESVKEFFARKYNKKIRTPFVVEDTKGSKYPIECFGVIEVNFSFFSSWVVIVELVAEIKVLAFPVNQTEYFLLIVGTTL